MKLKLRTQNTETLKTTLSLINPLRKFVTLRFTPEKLYVISVNGQSLTQEPQVWCNLQISSIFDHIEIQSLRDNTISLEINLELLLQTLRNFDRANSEGLNIRLQRKDSAGGQGTNTGNGRTASLALFYANVNANSNTINHTFRIPVKILKNTHDMMLLKEPELTDVELIMKLPNEFVSTYKRLDKFKKASNNETLTIKASRRGGGFLGFVLEEEGKYRVTISWNDKIDVQKPIRTNLAGESLRVSLVQNSVNSEDIDEDNQYEDKEITVKLKDWQMASKIVASCKTVVFLITPRDCVLHCLLDDSEDVEIIYYINGLRVRNPHDY
ncbi:checkpoint protein Hus1/Mec3 [Scheffersomyces xylosifermentans]|uniref:checkpoint protein Hus1/Mec3 n=1 Tax=Scheffersomyces xylosifermentans TaxID=1304137 RepID=UPI00315D7654